MSGTTKTMYVWHIAIGPVNYQAHVDIQPVEVRETLSFYLVDSRPMALQCYRRVPKDHPRLASTREEAVAKALESLKETKVDLQAKLNQVDRLIDEISKEIQADE